MPVIHVRLNERTHPLWQSLCQHRDIPPSTAVRQLVEAEVNKAHPPPPLKLVSHPSDQDKTRTVIFLTPSEVEAIRTRTVLNGGSRAGWIIRAIRAALTKTPTFDEGEIQAIRESNLQLVRLGNNLNQVARKLNDGQHIDQVQGIETLKTTIDAHMKHVNTLIDANRQRWDIEP